jgi:hypothetical protein
MSYRLTESKRKYRSELYLKAENKLSAEYDDLAMEALGKL